jgi:hypothetical protein
MASFKKKSPLVVFFCSWLKVQGSRLMVHGSWLMVHSSWLMVEG